MGVADELEQCVVDGEFEAQPVVEGLLHAPGGFAEVPQPDHAAAALEGVEAAPDGGEHLDVVGVPDQFGEPGGDGLAHIGGFFEEDFQQLGVEFLFAGVEEAGGLGGQGRRGRRLGQRGGFGEQRAGVEEGEGLAGLLLEFEVGGQGGVLAQAFEVELEFGAQADIVGVVLEGGGEGGGFALLLGDLGLDAVDGRGLAGVRVQDAFEVGRAVLQGLDVHAEGRQAVGDFLEGVGAGLGVLGGQRGDAGGGVLNQAHRGVLVHHREGALDLLEGGADRGQGVGLGGGAEEAVEALFDLGQAGLDLVDQLAVDLAALGVVLDDGEGAQALAPLVGAEPVEQGADLAVLAEVGPGVGVEAGVEQQHRRRHVHRQRIGEAERVLAQPAGEVAEGCGDLGDFRLVEGAGLVDDGGDGVLEAREADGATAGALVPGFPGGGEFVTQLAQDRAEGHVADAVPAAGDQVTELVGVADGLDGRGVGGGDRHVVEHVAHQALGDDGRAFHEAAHLAVDAAAQPLGGGVAGDGLLAESLEEGGDREPERPRGGNGLQALDAGDGLAHLLRAGGVVAVAEPLEQAALEAPPQVAQALRVVAGVGRLAEGRALGEVGEEQLAGGGRFEPPGGGELAIQGEQAQGLVGLAAGEFVQVVADGRNAAAGQPTQVGRRGDLFARHFAEQAVELLGELGQAVQADDGEGAVGLVQVGLGKLDLAGAVRGRPGLGERGVRSFEGQVDFAFDPGQRTEVEFVCGAHRCFSVGIRSRSGGLAVCGIRP